MGGGAAGRALSHCGAPRDSRCALMERLERRDRPFDVCFLDGSHSWETDGLAVLLLERLMVPGGLLIIDDLDWTFASSPERAGMGFAVKA